MLQWGSRLPVWRHLLPRLRRCRLGRPHRIRQSDQSEPGRSGRFGSDERQFALLVTGQTDQPLPVSDPDSLKLLPDGDLILTSEAHKAFAFIHDPGTVNQIESFITLPSSAGTPDDAVMVTAGSGTFYVSAQSLNEVIKVEATGLGPNDLYAW
jgi:hypothetical protein